MDFAKLAKTNEIPHFTCLSSLGANADSTFPDILYRGELERDIKELSLPHLTIFKPGAIIGKNGNFEFGDQTMSENPGYPVIGYKQLARALLQYTVYTLK